ncbi:hypothetical protein SAMN05216573_12146 [Bradyrhizobium sp. Rc3b]|nr:hypothetical protein SAMN05216573_12146 [Bradyrhizobium sp. Rc3b]
MEASRGKVMDEGSAAEWSRGYYLLVSVLVAALISVSVAPTLFERHPDTELPSCFDIEAKTGAAPGARCNPVF